MEDYPDMEQVVRGVGDSFHLESAAVHFVTAIAEWKAIREPGAQP